MTRLFRTLLVTTLAVMLFLYLNSLPDPKKPGVFLSVVQHIRGIISPGSGKLEEALLVQLRSMLRAQYGYELGPHRQIKLKVPPLLLDWPDNRPSTFYDYADTIAEVGPFYSPSLLSVYRAYGHFLDSIDLEKISGSQDSPGYIKRLQLYKDMLAKTNGVENEKAILVRKDIEKLLSEADSQEAKRRKSERQIALSLYAHAYMRYWNIAYKTNVEDSETKWLRPSYTMDPPLKEWVKSAPSFQLSSVNGETTLELHQVATAGNASGASGDTPVPSTLEGNTRATLDFKRVGKIDIRPGGWFDPYLIRYFSKLGAFRPGSNPWGPDGDFPSMPVGLIVAQDPSVALDLTGIHDQIDGATVTNIGPLQFDKSTVAVTTSDGKTTLTHNPQRVYLIAIITLEMPYVE